MITMVSSEAPIQPVVTIQMEKASLRITAAFLESAKRSAAGSTRAAPAKPAPGDTAHDKKGGHT